MRSAPRTSVKIPVPPPAKPPLQEIFDLSRAGGHYSEADHIALLRRSRRLPLDQLVVDFSGSQVQLELTADGRNVWRGDWLWQATVNAQSLAAAGPWEEVCWHTDADVDYLEVELSLTGGWRLQRQMLLARTSTFLLLADALLGPEPAQQPAPEIHYQSSLPLGADVSYSPASETREGWLVQRNRQLAPALPLALPEWRSEHSFGALVAADGRLTLSQAAQGRNLYAPLFFDLARDRFRKPLTWRRLTVAEELEIVPRDAAVGYRVQAGDWQWLVYRSLGAFGNRTVLGQNYSTEFVVCRFNRNGTTEDILEIK